MLGQLLGAEEGMLILINFLCSFLFISLLFLIRYFAIRWIRNPQLKWSSEQRRRWIANIKSLLLGAMLLGLAYIWSEQVYAFAVSIFAIALALVLAVKELILCLNGSLLRMRGNVYDVGDRIEINGIRGDVMDVGFLSTKVLEVGPGDLTQQLTGRSISIPNALLLSHPVINESFLANFLLHNIAIPLSREEDWRDAKRILLQVAQEECAPYLNQARRRVREIERKQTVDFPSVEPRISLHLPNFEEVTLVLRIPTPAHLKGKIERNILERFLEQYAPLPIQSRRHSRRSFPNNQMQLDGGTALDGEKWEAEPPAQEEETQERESYRAAEEGWPESAR